MARQSVSITVSLDDKDFTILREADIDWEGFPTPGLLELLDQVYQDARNGVQNVTPKAPF